MNFDLQQIISAFIAVFVIIDILGSIPIIMGIKEKNDDIKPLRVCLISFAIFILFLYGGEGILRLFKVDFQSFAVAGSLIIFVYAVEMVLDIEIFKNKGPEGSTSIVPLAFPLVAGPASFTTILSIRAEYAIENILIAIIMNLIFVYIVLRMTEKIEKLIGKGGIYIMRKFFGIILLAIAMKLFMGNIGSLL
ncbi:MAG TPA: MarC family protein [Paludibacteraceae bacterium]|jgi:multiple antibiotic resistance protein|nr:MarC family protein [Paludibacteraceae bacterium]HPS11120.1 MarC family protein [Paludibacteraceae bacterium]